MGGRTRPGLGGVTLLTLVAFAAPVIGDPPILEQVDQIARGFDLRPLSLDEARSRLAPHSMHDPLAYVRRRVPEGLFRQIRERHPIGQAIHVVVIDRSTGLTPDRLVQALPGTLRRSVDRFPEGSPARMLVSHDGLWVFDTRNHGRDMAVHKALIYTLAGLAPENLHLFSRRPTRLFNRVYQQSLATLGPADLAIIGYRRSLVRDLSLRKTAWLKARYLQGVLRPLAPEERDRTIASWLAAVPAGARAPFRVFLDRLQTQPPERFFLDSAVYETLRLAEQALTGPGHPPVGAALLPHLGADGLRTTTPSGGRVTVSDLTETPFDMRRFRVSIGRDAPRPAVLIATRHPYGESAGTLTYQLQQSGVTKVAFIGSAGALASDLVPGDVVVPEELHHLDHDLTLRGPWRPNALAGLRGPGVVAVDRHVSLASPLIEGMPLVDTLRSWGLASVDCEAAHVHRLALPGIEVASMLVITDVPGGAVTLEETAGPSPLLRRAQMRLLDHLLKWFDIQDVATR